MRQNLMRDFVAFFSGETCPIYKKFICLKRGKYNIIGVGEFCKKRGRYYGTFFEKRREENAVWK